MRQVWGWPKWYIVCCRVYTFVCIHIVCTHIVCCRVYTFVCIKGIHGIVSSDIATHTVMYGVGVRSYLADPKHASCCLEIAF